MPDLLQGTVDAHPRNIFTGLDVTSRAAVAALVAQEQRQQGILRGSRP